jgi:hypothetical protein
MGVVVLGRHNIIFLFKSLFKKHKKIFLTCLMHNVGMTFTHWPIAFDVSKKKKLHSSMHAPGLQS